MLAHFLRPFVNFFCFENLVALPQEFESSDISVESEVLFFNFKPIQLKEAPFAPLEANNLNISSIFFEPEESVNNVLSSRRRPAQMQNSDLLSLSCEGVIIYFLSYFNQLLVFSHLLTLLARLDHLREEY